MATTTWKQVVYDVADAVREVKGSEDLIPVGELADAVGGMTNTSDATITEYDVSLNKIAYGSDGQIIGKSPFEFLDIKDAPIMPLSAQWYSVTYGDNKFVAVASSTTKAAYSTDGITWTESTLPSSASWRSIAYGDGKFVTLGYNSTKVAYSEDGINWTASSLPSSANWTSITYGNDKFVTVGFNSTKAAYSEDGITWTEVTMPLSAYWQSVTYGDGKFVAITGGPSYSRNIAAYSTDGITWTQTTLPASDRWTSVTYGDNKFVAVASSSAKVAYSTDGITWTESKISSSAYWRAVTYGDNKFVAVVNNSAKVAYSTDGITWTEVTMPSAAQWYSITYGDGKFVTLGYNSTKVAYSLNGITWVLSEEYSYLASDSNVALYLTGQSNEKRRLLNTSSELKFDGDYTTSDANNIDPKSLSKDLVAYDVNGRLVGESPFIFDHAVDATLPESTYWGLIIYGNDKFVAMSSSMNKCAYSMDGLTWIKTTSVPPFSGQWCSGTYGNGKFVAVSNGSTRVAYSTDGITWKGSTLPDSTFPSSSSKYAVAYGDGKFVAIANNSDKVAYSEDGITWTESSLPSSADWRSITYGNDKFVAVAQSDTVAYSVDGVNWTTSTLSPSTYWSSVTYGNGKFVAVASNSNTAARSEDGITWYSFALPSSASWCPITYGNGKFVAVGSNSNTVVYSEDGVTWAKTTLPVSANWKSLAYGEGKFVAIVYSSDTVAYSLDGILWSSVGSLCYTINDYLGAGVMLNADGCSEKRIYIEDNTILMDNNMVNGIIESYFATADTIDANTFVEFIDELHYSNTITDAISTPNASYGISAVKLSNNSVFIAYGGDYDKYVYGVVLRFNGSNITVGTVTTICSVAGSGGWVSACALTSYSVIVLHQYSSAHLYGTYVGISGTSITKGNTTALKSNTSYGGFFQIVALSENKALVTCSGDSSSIYSFTVTANNSTLTAGMGMTVASLSYSHAYSYTIPLTSYYSLVLYNDNGNLYGKIIGTDGLGVGSVYSALQIDTNVAYKGFMGVALSENRAFVLYYSGSNIKGVTLANYSGILSVETNITTTLTSNNVDTYNIDAILLSENVVYVAYSNKSDGHIHGMHIGINGAYPTVMLDEVIYDVDYYGSYIHLLPLSTQYGIFMSHVGNGTNNFANMYIKCGFITEAERKVVPSVTKINGFTQTPVSATEAGKVWILNS